MRPYVPTFTPVWNLREDATDLRYDFLIGNHKAALETLEHVRKRQHRQGIWAQREEKNVCGTSGCALGWIAMTDTLPGLQYTIDNDNEYYAVVNTEKMNDWEDAGKRFFGETTQEEIFNRSHFTMPQIRKLMRLRIKELEAQRKLPEDDRPEE